MSANDLTLNQTKYTNLTLEMIIQKWINALLVGSHSNNKLSIILLIFALNLIFEVKVNYDPPTQLGRPLVLTGFIQEKRGKCGLSVLFVDQLWFHF